MIGYEDIVWSSAGFELVGVTYNALALPAQHNHFALYNNSVTATISGIDRDSVLGRPVWFTNRGSQNIRFLHDNAAADADKRLACPGGVSYTLLPGESCLAVYNSNDDRTEIIGVPAYTDSVGTTFPDAPYDGQGYFRTDLREEFHYDASAEVWYGSLPVTFNWHDNSVTASGTGQYLLAGSAVQGATNGYAIPDGWEEGRLIEVAAAWTGNISGSFTIRQNGTAKRTIVSAATDRIEAIDIFDKLDSNTEIESAFQFNTGSITNITAWAQVVRAFDVAAEEEGN